MKLLRILLIGAAVAWIVLTIHEAHAAVILQSYSDPACTIQCEDFTQGTVYMKATGLNKNKSYTARYYDSAGMLLLTEVSASDSSGTWLGSITPAGYPNSAPGAWRADLYNWNESIVGADTFTVQGSAIPEVSDFFGLIPLAIVPLGIYLIRRGK